MRNKQFEFGSATKRRMTFGGASLKGNAREKRPFHKHMHTHLVMRSRLAVGEKSMLRRNNRARVDAIVQQMSRRFFVKVERYVNVGNHLHLLIKAPNREAQANFLRTISGRIARLIMNSEKGRPAKFEQFWDAKPFTSLVAYGKHFKNILFYLSLNSLEAIGFTKTSARNYIAGFSSA